MSQHTLREEAIHERICQAYAMRGSAKSLESLATFVRLTIRDVRDNEVSSVISRLEELGWMKQRQGLYIMTV